jgi:hypothetical protein
MTCEERESGWSDGGLVLQREAEVIRGLGFEMDDEWGCSG